MFLPVKHDTGAVQPFEYMQAAAGTYKAGQLLTTISGYLQRIAEACVTTPPYLCVADIIIENSGGLLPVTRVSDDIVYEATLDQVTAEDIVIGEKLQVTAGGMSASDETPGTFQVVAYGDDVDHIRGRFV